jgi:hypothetical protein
MGSMFNYPEMQASVNDSNFINISHNNTNFQPY